MIADLFSASDDELAERGGQLSGKLRINGSERAVAALLKTAVPAFMSAHPGVSLDLVVEGQLVDIVEHRFDAGVRLAEAVPQDMIAVPLGDDLRFLVVSAPFYLAAAGCPAVPNDLHRHRCIRQRLPSGKLYRWEFARHGQEVAIDVPGALTLNHTMLMIEAAADGLGVAYIPETAALPWLENGRLVALLEDWSPLVGGLQLYYPGRRHVRPSLWAFIDIVRGVS